MYFGLRKSKIQKYSSYGCDLQHKPGDIVKFLNIKKKRP